MRPTIAQSILGVTLIGLVGCSHAAPNTIAPTLTTKAAPAVAALEAPQSRETEEPTVTLNPEVAQTGQGPSSMDEAVAGATEVTVTPVTSEVRRSTGDAGVANILDPYRPYNVGVVAATHNSVTLTWRTDLDSRATVAFGRTFGISWHGFNRVYPENQSSHFHQVTIGALSRFTKYRFVVVGLGPLGLQFPAYAIDFRTPLF